MTSYNEPNAPRCYVVSATLEGLTETENEKRHAELVAHCVCFGVAHRECQGRFAGSLEDCVILAGAGAGRHARALALHYGQDSFLAIAENDRGAYLVDTTTHFHKSIGTLRNVGLVRPDGDYTAVDGWFYQARPPVGCDLPEGIDGPVVIRDRGRTVDAIDILTDGEGE